MAISNEEELFTEASGELQSEVEDALASARDSLPRQESLVVEGNAALSEVVAGLPAEFDPSEPAEALRTAQKRFALGEQADAFNEEFAAEMRTALDELEDAVNALYTVAHTAPELAGALTTLHEVHPETEAAQTDSPVPEPEESGVAESLPGPEEGATVPADESSDESQQTITEESAATDTDDDQASDDDDGTDDGDDESKEDTGTGGGDE
jgi:hypothetical protein